MTDNRRPEARRRPGRWRQHIALGCTLAGAALAMPPSAGAVPNLKTGFDDSVFNSADDSLRQTWFDNAVAANAGVTRVLTTWRTIAPTEPASPRDPTDPAYNFGWLDRTVREADSRGMEVLLTVFSAPLWAEGGNRPADVRTGSWKPDPEAYADFGRALASRYSGSFGDPTSEGSGSLPRVRYYEAWNEPGHNVFLNPQWKGKKPKSPERYRKLLNGFYDAVKSVRKSNKVIGPATHPHGDPRGGDRMRPLLFIRELFCLHGRKNPRPKANCKQRKLPKLDIVSVHPISAFVGGPQASAKSPDDVGSGNLDRVTKVMRAAERAGHLLPRKGRHRSKRRKLWVSEFFWFSNPPVKERYAVKLNQHARWTQKSLYVFWKGGARAAVQLGIRDAPDSLPATPQPFGSGLFFVDGERKPAFTAFRFPFVAERKSPRKVKVWGKSPTAGNLKVERRSAGGWKTIERFRVSEDKVFYKKVRLRGKAELRGRVGGQRTLVWKQKN